MDVQMPEMDGLEATRRIRAEELRRNLVRTPILALTAHASKAHREQCLAEGIDAVITKPVNLPTLLREIAAAMHAAHALVRPAYTLGRRVLDEASAAAGALWCDDARCRRFISAPSSGGR